MNMINSILSLIAANGLKIRTKQFLDGYPLFYMGKSSVCHFTLKETPNWKYGIWLNEDESYSIFGEQVELIDKFKSSRTYISCDGVQNFVQHVKSIAQYPIHHFVASLTYDYGSVFGRGNSLHPSPDTNEYVQRKYEEYYQRAVEELKVYNVGLQRTYKMFNQILSLDGVQAVGVKDKNKKGISCSPRFEVNIVVEDRFTNDDVFYFDTIVSDIIKAHNDSLRDRSSYLSSFDFGCSLDCIYNKLSNIAKCDIKLRK